MRPHFWRAVVVAAVCVVGGEEKKQCFLYLEQEHLGASYVTAALKEEAGFCSLAHFEASKCSLAKSWVVAGAGAVLEGTRALEECLLFTLFREPVASFMSGYHANLWRRTNATVEEWATRPDGRGQPAPAWRQLFTAFVEEHRRGGRELRMIGSGKKKKKQKAAVSSSAMLLVESVARRVREGAIFGVVGLLERPVETAAWWDSEIPLTTKSWASVFDLTSRRVRKENLNLEELRMMRLFEPEILSLMGPDLALYEAATRLLYANSRELDFTEECAERPYAGGYLWLHSLGHAPNQGVKPHGVTGWTQVLARAVALAKRLGTGLIVPCVKNSILVPCRVPPGRLQRSDPLPPMTGEVLYDDDIKQRGFTDEMDRWLNNEEDDDDDDDGGDDEDTETDDATRGLNRGVHLDDLGAYFDLQFIADHLGGSLDRVLTVDCAARHAAANPHLTRMSWVTQHHPFPAMKKQLKGALVEPVELSIVRLGGGMDLDSLKDQEAVDLLYAPSLRRTAREYAEKELNSLFSSYAVVHWRAEPTLATATFQECAGLVLAEIAALKERFDNVLLVSDLAFDESRPLWLGVEAKLDLLPDDKMVRAFVREATEVLGAKKYDQKLWTDDVGALAIVEQILATDAKVFSSHIDDDDDFCGGGGKFGKAIANKRLANSRPVSSWMQRRNDS